MKKKHLISLAYALGIPIVMIVLGMSLPNKSIEGSFHYSVIDKTELLKNSHSPKIILVGGSNIGFGMNSPELEKKTGYKVANMGVHGGYGLLFYIKQSEDYIRKGDVIVVSPEYRNFYGSSLNGDWVLLNLLFDAYPAATEYISLKHWLHLSQFFPKYAVKKLNSFFKFYFVPREAIETNDVYLRSSYNSNGDVTTHWGLEPRPFSPYGSPWGDYNPQAIQELLKFQQHCKNIGAQVFVTFPSLQKASFNNMKPKIDLALEKLQAAKFQLLGSPDRYCFDDSLFFNTAYHLSKTGVDIRTKFLIEDLKKEGIGG